MLEIIKDVKKACNNFTRRTTRLLAHLINILSFTNSPRLLLSRRLIAL
jgi:hypothetical protein